MVGMTHLFKEMVPPPPVDEVVAVAVFEKEETAESSPKADTR